jgi:hypothetical protein
LLKTVLEVLQSLQATQPLEARLPLLLQVPPPLNRPTLAVPAPLEVSLPVLDPLTPLVPANARVSAVQHHSPTLQFKVLALLAVFQVSHPLPIEKSENNFNSQILGAMPMSALISS